MKTMIALAMLIAPSALAFGNYETTYQIGNSRFTNGYDRDTGNSYNYNTYQTGNMVIGSGTDSRGNHVSCTSYRIGNTVQTNCY